MRNQQQTLQRVNMPHSIILENRNHCEISGVTDVDSFSEEAVLLITEKGQLYITGTALHIDKLSLETGQLTLNGNVESLTYYDSRAKGDSIFSRLFK